MCVQFHFQNLFLFNLLDDVEVVYENDTAGDKLKVVSETIPAGKVVNEAVDDDEDEDEVNIDDI